MCSNLLKVVGLHCLLMLQSQSLCFLNYRVEVGANQTMHKNQFKAYVWAHQGTNTKGDRIFKGYKIDNEDVKPNNIYQQYCDWFILISIDSLTKDYVICVAYCYPFCLMNTQQTDNPFYLDFIASMTQEHYEQLRAKRKIKFICKGDLMPDVSMENTHDATFIKSIIAKIHKE